MAQDAKEFLSSFTWCKEITELYFGCGIGGVIAVFLAQIIPSESTVDDWLWIVVGDVPPAYLVVDYSTVPADALRSMEYRYTVLFEPADEGGFTVTCPALPGLVTEGDTLEEARAMAADAICGYIESLRKDHLTLDKLCCDAERQRLGLPRLRA